MILRQVQALWIDTADPEGELYLPIRDAVVLLCIKPGGPRWVELWNWIPA